MFRIEMDVNFIIGLLDWQCLAVAQAKDLLFFLNIYKRPICSHFSRNEANHSKTER